MVQVKEMDPAEAFEAELMSRQKAMHEATARGDSAVQQFYNNAVVFVTGGSGFLGKQLIEKIIRASNISTIIILLRPKKGRSIQQRLKQMLEDPVFEMVREQKPNFEEQITAVEGDAAELRLGLSDKDWNMIVEQTDIIFHMAATTRFDECLRVSTMINVRGTREALLLGKACKKLKFVKLYQKTHKMSMALSYFTLNDWEFSDKNTEILYESLSEADKEIFEFDIKRIDWVDFMTTWGIGLRKYIIKDNLKNTKNGQRKQFLFKILMAIIAPVYIYMLYKVICVSFTILSYVCNIFLVNK